MEYVTFAVLAPVSLLTIAITLVYAWTHRTVPGALVLVGYLLMVAGLLACNTFELVDQTEAGTLLWAKLSYIFYAFLPPAWLAYALYYCGRPAWCAPSRIWVFMVIPVLTMIFAQTNALHHMIWQEVEFVGVPGGFLAMRVMAYGQWFWVHLAYTYCLLAVGTYLVWKEYFVGHALYRRQSLWAIAGVLIPLIANGIYLSRQLEWMQKDFTPIAFAASGVFFALGIYKYRVFSLKPIARTLLVDMLPDGVMILDNQLRVVDANPAARAILKLPEPAPIGMPIDLVWPDSRMWLSFPAQGDGTVSPGRRAWADLPTRPDVIRVEIDGVRRAYSLLLSPIAIPGRRSIQTGWLLVLSDVTRRVDAEGALVAANTALAESVRAQAEANARLRDLNEELEDRVAARTQALAQRADELESLARISAAMRQAVGQRELLTVLVDETAAVTGADAGWLFMIENEALVLRACLGGFRPDGPSHEAHDGTRHLPTRDPLWAAVESVRASIVYPEQVEAEGRAGFFHMLARGSATVALAPFRAADRTLGLLWLGFSHPPVRPFNEWEHVLAAVADMAGNALLRVRTMENLEALVQARTRGLTTLYEVATVTNQFLDLSGLLQRVLEMMMQALGLRAALIHLADDEGSTRLAASAGLDSAALDRLPAPRDPAAPWQRVLAQDKIVVAGPESLKGSRGQGDGQGLGDGQLAGEPFAVSLPVRAKGRLLGALTVLDEKIGRLSAEDIAMLAAVADHTGVAVESSRLHRRAEQAAVIEERQRLARDLHDSVTQTLYSLVLFSEAGIDALKASAPDKAMHYLDRQRDSAQQALREMRLLIYELRPQALQREGLAGALRYRLDSVERRSGMQASLEIHQDVPLPGAVENGLYGIAQEALNNVLKHAHASQVTVRLSAEQAAPGAEGQEELYASRARVELEITDNGTGFQVPTDCQDGELAFTRAAGADPLEAGLNGGIGLSSMRERARALGGTLSIQSSAGQGTRVLAALDFEESAYDSA